MLAFYSYKFVTKKDLIYYPRLYKEEFEKTAIYLQLGLFLMNKREIP